MTLRFVKDIAITQGYTIYVGGIFLDVIPGRTVRELRDYYKQKSIWCTLNPIADRFHVNRYVTGALQNVRKHIQNNLSPFAKVDLKQHFRILGKRYD